MWLEAAEQSLASLSLGQGTLLVLSSFSEFGNRTPRDALLVASVDVVSCLLSCATVHAQLGHLSRMLGVSVREALPPTSGLGIAFVAVPEALLRMGGSRIWTFAFFVALYMLGFTASVRPVLPARVVHERHEHRAHLRHGAGRHQFRIWCVALPLFQSSCAFMLRSPLSRFWIFTWKYTAWPCHTAVSDA